ncbi:MAG: hypothetical protein H6Q69_5076 [Firmicutes bacterium]|nr:hypothetical protein [Bacillota bacterium]
MAREYLERMIGYQPGNAKKEKEDRQANSPRPSTVTYLCLGCDMQEEIPYQVVRDFDKQDLGDPSVPPQFACESCGVAMYTRYYKGVHGIKYRISDVRDT